MLLETYGLTIRYLSTLMFSEKNYSVGYYKDSEKLDSLIHFRSKNLDVYYSSLEKYKYKLINN